MGEVRIDGQVDHRKDGKRDTYASMMRKKSRGGGLWNIWTGGSSVTEEASLEMAD